MRRLRALVATGPLPALIGVAVAAAAPFACVRLGSALGDELQGSLGSHAVASAILAGPVLAAAVAGMALAVSLPGRSGLGVQIAAAPFRDAEAVIASCVVPAVGFLLLAVPPLAAFDLALVTRLDRGPAVGVALVLATFAAAPAGAILAEAVLAGARGAWRRAALVGVGACGWSLLGWRLGGAALGPLAAAARALRGDVDGVWACALAAVALVVLAAGWVPLAARRPARRARSARSPLRIVRGETGATPAALLALLTRRGDVRLASAGALAFGAGGVGMAALSGAPPPAALMLGTTTALLGSVVASLVVFGALCDGRWLWSGAPRARSGVACAAWLAAVVVTLAPVAAVAVGAILVEPASWSAVGTIAVVALVAADAAVVAGVLVPWGAGAGEQLTTFAAFGAVAIAASLAVGVVAPRVVALGVPDALLAVALCCTGGWGAVQALSSGLAGGRR